MPKSGRPPFEVADVFRRFGDEYRAKGCLSFDQLRVMQHIEDCRTAALGGHLEECDTCKYEHPAYNSCRDRHCPKCQVLTKERWLEARKAELLPVNYFHQVFTVPHELNRLILSNKKIGLDILFAAAAETLLDFGKDPKQRLGGKLGFSLVLHTWNQKLFDHFHIHGVIPAGALRDDGTWANAKHDDYLFPIDPMSRAFRGKFIARLRQAFERDELIFPGELGELAHPIRFEMLLDGLARKHWHCYLKPPFGGPESVLSYLGRYTHRIAISNHRIVDIGKDSVTFSYRDRSDGNKEKTETVSGEEFIRRFLLHTLPGGFVRIRHYGFLACRNKRELLAQCRLALNANPPAVNPSPPKTAVEYLLRLTGIDVLACPRCGIGRMQKRSLLPKFKSRPSSSWRRRSPSFEREEFQDSS